MTSEAKDVADGTAAVRRALVPALMFIALVVAVVGGLGAPLITSVATTYRVSAASAQWTLTITLLVGAIATPVLGRLGAGPGRRRVILATLAVVLAGSMLTVVPAPFGVLLLGRTAQGVGLGLTALTMAVARDHLPPARARSAVALLSVASTVGVGIAYPLAGLLTDLAGIRAAYGLGVVVTGAAFLTAARTIPTAPRARRASVDLPGAALLGAGLLALLLVIGQSGLWSGGGWRAVAMLAGSVLLLAGWVWRERRAPAPLVDLTLLRHPEVAGANTVMLLGGVGMYLLLTLVTRYVQTPPGTGYGFGASTLVASLVLVPFSVLGFVGGRAVPPVRARLSATAVLVLGAAVVLAALVFFAVARNLLWEPFAAMALLGAGVGVFSAAMPDVILAVTPAAETASAMGVNQVVRSVGFSTGSATCGLVLALFTPQRPDAFPTDRGFGVAAWLGAALMAATIVITLLIRRGADAAVKRAV
jgi:predicted MFS family arabinose efflux permease